jgi:NTP pyrophosphatase (non-canonical NTP hydrolase)
MEHFNQLTPAEAERLALLAEELGEATQAIGKILRHGYQSRHPLGGPTNRQALEKELGDVRHAMIRLCDAGDLSKQHIHDMADVKALNVEKYLHHQEGAA